MDRSAMPSAPKEFAPAKTQREWESNVERSVGSEALERVKAEKDAVTRRKILNEAFRKTLKEQHPELNGELEKVAKERTEKLMLNAQELDRKESWLTWTLKAPFRGLKWLGKKTFVEHPFLTTAALVILILYFMPAVPGVGALRDSMIQGGKEVLKKLGVGMPAVSTDAIAQVSATGGMPSEAVMQKGAEILAAPGGVQQHIDKLDAIIKQP